MQWTDDGIVLGIRRHGEANAILELMTREHGRHLGLVRGGAGSRLRPVLQPGNRVNATWRARLDEHLGNFTVEALDLPAAGFLGFAHAVYGVTHLAALCRLLPERDPHPLTYAALAHILDQITDARLVGAELVRFELHMLGELGFGLDLESCAATGSTTALAYVSPKSGRAVSLEAGAPWRDKLLQLPAFLRDGGDEPCGDELCAEAIADGFALTGYFLSRHVFEPRGSALPDARESLVSAVLKAFVTERAAS
jgi:DNA repair protein RecO (recombination protein O)